MNIRNSASITASAVIAFALAGCQAKPDAATAPAAAVPVSEADATKVADATEATWTSMDAAKIKALYAPEVVGFDPMMPPLVTDRAAWDKGQDAYAAAKIDKADRKQRQIQILGADTFVLSGVWALTSSATPANNMTIRCTDVFKKAADGTWPIVNEHCSQPPKA